MTLDAYEFLDPLADQSYGIVKLLNASRGGRDAYVGDGVGRLPRFARKLYAFGSSPSDAIKVPSVAESTEAMLRKGDIHVGSVTMTQDMLRCYSKESFLLDAENVGVRIPRQYQYGQLDSIEYPIFYKEAYERGGGRRGIARSSSELPDDKEDSPLLYQEYIPGVGTFGAAFVAESGKVLASSMHHEVASFPKTGGSAVIIERWDDPELREQLSILVSEFNLSGWGVAEFKRHAVTGDYVLMEVNAKFWASIEFTLRNSASMFQLLFGGDAPWEPIQKLVFVNRLAGAVAEGNLAALAQSRKANGVLYPNSKSYLKKAASSHFDKFF